MNVLKSIMQLIEDVKELISLVKALKVIKNLIQTVLQPKLKALCLDIAASIDKTIAEFQTSPDPIDDRLIPALQTVSNWFKKIGA